MNENDKLNQLQNELNECREDERHSEDILIQVLCTAGTILGIILGASYMTSNDSPINPLYVLILNDLIFLTAFSYIVVLGIQNLLRYFHIRNLEKQLCLDTSHIEWFHLSSPITTRNPLHIFRSFYTTVHYSAYTISTLCAILFGIGTTCALYEKTAPGDNIAFIALVFPLGFMFLTAIIYFSFCVRAEKMYQFALTYATLHKSKTSSKDSFFSKVLVYFFYPKVKDFQKPFLIVLGFGSGLLLKTGKLTWTLISNQLMNLILTLIVIDFLLYQARYLLNDIRNIKEDQAVQKSDRLPVHFLGEKIPLLQLFPLLLSEFLSLSFLSMWLLSTWFFRLHYAQFSSAFLR